MHVKNSEKEEKGIEEDITILPVTAQQKEALKHSKSYSILVDAYVNSVEKNLNHKEFLKQVFFWAIMLVLMAIVVTFIWSISFAKDFLVCMSKTEGLHTETIIGIITILVPIITSLIVAFLKLPEIIAKYLFNPQEDESMTSIIKNLQDYDIGILELEHDVKELLGKNKKTTPETKDDEIPAMEEARKTG